MATVILQRHGRTTANAGGVLAGRLPGVRLDETGRQQAQDAAARLLAVPLVGAVSSPQERCGETASYVVDALAAQGRTLAVEIDERLAECDYGDWQGRPLKELAGEDLWKVVQRQPSAATFPGGESLRTMQRRAVDAVRERDAALEAAHGENAVWLAVTHGDIVKAVLADALGMHLDLFQRLHADPASLTIIRYGAARPVVLQANSHAGDLAWLDRPPAGGDVGGGAGPGASPSEAAAPAAAPTTTS
ncbi:MAG TPA: MSMEG_4193 family putative phosphomutase [Nocardioides sp.]